MSCKMGVADAQRRSPRFCLLMIGLEHGIERKIRFKLVAINIQI
jgi:hypothetical protein